MRTIRRTTAFKRDHKRERKGRFADTPLDPSHRDHALTGRWNNHRDCHLRPDLVLIYRKPDDNHLDLVRLGSHAKLGF